MLIGIGFNVNEECFPEDLKSIATSLKIEFKKEFSREDIIAVFCNKFDEYCVNRGIVETPVAHWQSLFKGTIIKKEMSSEQIAF